MKKLLFLFALAFCLNAAAQTDNPKYDKALATSLGADEYGMKHYIFVLLKSGQIKIDDEVWISKLFKGHMENMNRLVKEGKLIVSGPFGTNDNHYRGLFILNVATIAEANALLAKDPAIKERLLEAEVYEWYGSAALGEYLKVHETIEKIKP
jgi:uncharacterized protein YciI